MRNYKTTVIETSVSGLVRDVVTVPYLRWDKQWKIMNFSLPKAKFFSIFIITR